MGSWYGTCAISNLHVYSGKEVAVFMLLANEENKSFCYGNALYDLCPIPFYGKYNDYGGVEDCHGFGMDIVVNELKRQLYQFGQGPNSCHDITVNRDNFDIDMLFEADHEDRLGIQNHRSWSSDSYDLGELKRQKDDKGLTDDQQFELDRLAAKIKQQDTFRRVTHVIIHGDVFKDIMEKWYIEDYVGNGKGTSGYGNNYNHVYFKDIVDSIPAYVAAKKKAVEDMEKEEDGQAKWLLKRMSRDDGWDSPNLATKWLSHFSRSSTMEYGLIDTSSYIEDYVEERDWEGLAAFVKEALTGMWVNSFMTFTRKIWTKQTGAGSQNSEHLGYTILAKSMLEIMKAEKAEYGYEEEEVEDEPEEETRV